VIMFVVFCHDFCAESKIFNHSGRLEMFWAVKCKDDADYIKPCVAIEVERIREVLTNAEMFG